MAVKARAQITLSCVIDVQATYRYYLLQSSTLAKPSKPTVNPPTGSWNDAEPTYTAGSTNSLYFVDLTVFSDGTFAYSSVSLSSSYEAAKEAYNKAQAAQDTAQNAKDAVDNLEIGGRNLLPGTQTMSAYTKSSNVTLETDSEGFGVATFAAVSTLAWNSVRTNAPIQYSIVRDKTVTLSFYVRSNEYELLNAATDRGLCVSFALCTGTSTTRTLFRDHRLYSLELTDKWQKVTITVTLSDSFLISGSGTIDDDTRFYIAIFNYSLYNTEVKKIKLEFGNVATDWTPAPEDIDAAISNAQTTADGKNSIFYQDTAPLATGRKEYDIWFDTDDDNKMYYFDGSAWVEKQFGTDAIADSTIVARLIASSTITGDKLVADSITAREIAAKTITANEIAANAITSAEIATGAVTADKISVTDLYAIGATIGGFSITSTKLYAGTTAGNMIAMQTGGTWAFAAGATSHSSYADAAFRVNHAGELYASKAEIEGKITATSGTIGGWSISGTKIYGGDSSTGVAAMQLPTSTNLYAFAVGGASHDSYADCPFKVTKAGKLYSSDFEIGPMFSQNEDIYCSKAIFVQYGLELFADNDAGTPYVDFHYGKTFGTTNDYTSRIYASTANRLSIRPSASYTAEVQVLNEVSGEYRLVLRSDTNGTGYLGTTSYRWNTAFFTNAITASDKKLKNILGDIDEAVDFVMSLKPYRYTFKDGDSGRVHMGLIAQDVAQTAKDLQMGDLALYQAAVINEDGTESYYDESVADEQLSWGLNYNELIAPLTAALQYYMAKVDKLEKKVNALTA